MKRDRVIKLADELLNNISEVRASIKHIDVELKKRTYTSNEIEKLKYERNKFNKKLTKVVKAIGTLNVEEQKIICYRYFEKMKIKDIASIVGYDPTTIRRKINKSKLEIGRIVFGFEDEFFRNILDFAYDQ